MGAVTQPVPSDGDPRERSREALTLSERLIRLAGRDLTRVEFLAAACRELAQGSGAAALQLWAPEADRWLRAQVDASGRAEVDGLPRTSDGSDGSTMAAMARLEPVGWDHGLFVARSAGRPDDSTAVLVPVPAAHAPDAWLVVRVAGPDYVTRRSVDALVRSAGPLAVALDQQRLVAALRERVKEMTSLMRLSRLEARADETLDALLAEIAGLLPPAWQYPDITVAGLKVDGRTFVAGAADREMTSVLRAPLDIGDRRRGEVWVGYVEPRTTIDDGPFLREERELLDTVARQIGAMLERREAREERARLETQLRHADRLATIGTLAAGVAHELNEPLGAVLGFSQLARRHEDLPPDAAADLGKIEAAALHAREIVRQLMLFARQAPTEVQPVDPNQVVRDALAMLTSRCRRAGVEPQLDLSDDLPEVRADRSQLQQVVINLAVNAIQSMPHGGPLRFATRSVDDTVELTVTDQGVGMSAEVLEKVFLPFFTTKEVNEGTGLGLAVVHGIVTAHGGTIDLESTPGTGTTARVSFPAEGRSS
jgi:two-component system NtrC family sensor kinase